MQRLSTLALSLITVALTATAIWGAWDYGGGYWSTKLVMACVALLLIPAGLAVCILTRSICPPPAITWLACLTCLIALFQCARLPPSLVGMLAPGSLAAYQEWVPESIRQETEESNASHNTFISVAPSYTRMALVVPASLAVACWLSVMLFSNPRLGLAFLLATAVAGAVFAFFGLADAIRLARDSNVELRQRLVITPLWADGPFGPFVNNNNCAGYLNLAIGCAMGVVAYLTGSQRVLRQGWTKPASSSDGATAGPGRLSLLLQNLADPTSVFRHWRITACVLMIVVMVAGILGSSSRGGTLGLTAGAVVLGLAAFRAVRPRRVIIMLGCIVMVALLLLYGLGMLQQTESRLKTLYQGEALQDPRLAHWQDAISAATHYFPAGGGLGTYRYAYLPYQQHGRQTWFHHADGMPVEFLLEGGLWLPTFVVLGLVLLIRDVRRVASGSAALEEPQARIARAVATTGTFIIPSMLVTQTFDYGILQPPLLLTFAIICGGIGCYATQKPADASTPPRFEYLQLAGGIVVLVVAASALFLSARELSTAMIVQRSETQRWRQRHTALDQLPSYQRDIETLQQQSARLPDNPMTHRHLALLLIDEQRRLGARYLVEKELATPQRVDRWVSPRTVRLAYYGDVDHPPYTMDELMLPTQDMQAWKEARKRAAIALVHCPLDDISRMILVELDMVHETANIATPELIEQVGRLRCRNDRILRRLIALSKVYPGEATTRRIEFYRRELN